MSNYLLIQVGDNKEEDSSKVGEDNNKVVSKDGVTQEDRCQEDGEVSSKVSEEVSKDGDTNPLTL